MFALKSRFWLVPCAALVCRPGTLNERGRTPHAPWGSRGANFGRAFRQDGEKENKMRMVIAAVVAMTTSAAMAGEIEDAHRQAVAARDSYWNCLAQEYSRDSNKSMSGQDFTLHIASVCPSERQNFRVMLVGYLTMQFPGDDAGEHMTTANNAIALAQKDIVTAFIRHMAAPK
jgi:hypothetical protein